MCCKPVYRVRWLKNKAAILIIIWSFLVTSVYHLLRNGYSDEPKQQNITVMGIIMVAATLLFPIGGWLADTYFGRYKTIHYSMWIMWIVTVSGTVSELLADGNAFYSSHIKRPVMYVLTVILAIGLGGFQSNIVQLGIDQLTDASTTEITSFITWYTLTPFMSGITLQYATDCTIDRGSFYTKTMAVALCLSIALCLDCLFHHWLDKEHTNQPSLNLVYKVVKFLVKERHSIVVENGTTISRFNVAKHMYGGPFTNQQVEDVKSTLHIIFLIAICSTVAGGITPVEYAKEKVEHTMQGWSDKQGLTGCYKRLSIRYCDYLFTIAVVVLYEFIIHPLYINFFAKIKITSRFLIGIVLFLFRIVALLTIEIAAYGEIGNNINSTVLYDDTECIFTTKDKSEVTFVSYNWLLAPGFMSGLSSFLFLASAIEFIWAQTPYFMSGLALGTLYAFIGLNTIIQTAIVSPFLFINVSWRNIPLTCGIWYFLYQGVLVVIFLTVGIIMVSKYKRRDRNDSSLMSYTASVNDYKSIDQLDNSP